jgi:hypothetical protein
MYTLGPFMLWALCSLNRSSTHVLFSVHGRTQPDVRKLFQKTPAGSMVLYYSGTGLETVNSPVCQ